MQAAIVVRDATLANFLTQVNEFITQYKQLGCEVSNEIIDFVKTILDTHAIKFPHDPSTAFERIRMLQAKYPSEKIPLRMRMVLKTRRTKADFHNELVRICNGLVLVIEETDQGLVCKPLAIPAHEVNPSVGEDVAYHLRSRTEGEGEPDRDYDVYAIKDGTVLNLYYDPGYCYEVTEGGETKLCRGRWFYGSRNSFNVEETRWRGFQYRDIIDQLTRKYPIFQLENLDKERTYTIGIRHPAFHPFNQPAVWTAQSSLDDQNAWLYEMWLIVSTSIDFKTTKPDIGIPVQKPIGLELDLPTIHRYCQISLDVFLGASVRRPMRDVQRPKASDLPPDLEHFRLCQGKQIHISDAKGEVTVETPPIFFGYILRMKPHAIAANPNSSVQDVIIESRLWTEIRNMVYESPKTRMRDRRSKAAHFRDVRYMVLHNLMNRINLRYFNIAFPQYRNLYANQERRIDVVVDLIHELLSGHIPKNASLRATDTEEQKAEVKSWRDEYSAFAARLATMIENSYQVAKGPNVKQAVVNTDKTMIKDYLVHLKYLDVFYESLYPSP